jgi:N-acetylmuramoyl-L-alanine amidase
MKIVISSGHGKYIRGASGYIDEVDEARKVVNRVAELFGQAATVFHDDVSDDQSENLNRIVDFHNSIDRDLDVSVHFNAYNITDEPMGCECLYLTQAELAGVVSNRISMAAGFKNRGAKKRDDLFFLNKTDKSSILIETCFVDSKADADLYRKNFESICAAISGAISGVKPIEIPTGLNELLVIEPVTIYEKDNGQYIRFISDLDICNDGSGPSHGDPHHQSQTAYYSGGKGGGKYLNADVDKYIVIPPQVRSKIAPVVMGCKGRLTNLNLGVSEDGVVGEIGSDDKTGEAAYCLSKIVNPSVTYNSGDKKLIYLYELWPGVPAVVDGFSYKLQPS